VTRPKKVVHLVLTCLILGLVGLGSARAELLVSDVTGVEGITPGARFPDDHVFKLLPRSEIKLIKLPDNIPFVMRGPYEGTLSKFVRDCHGALSPVHSYCGDTAGTDVVTPSHAR
jgi:hypothetical protein